MQKTKCMFGWDNILNILAKCKKKLLYLIEH